MPINTPSYQIITETPLTRGSHEQVRRLYARYKFATDYCRGKDVLEVACGAGIGLGFLASVARRVIGGDIDQDNLSIAKQTYEGRSNLEIIHIDAHSLPFEDSSFDAIILYEAIYYLKFPEKFILEARRILRKNGTLIIGSANREWSGFNPSPHSHRYFSANELYLMMVGNGFNVHIFADCPIIDDSFKSIIMNSMKKTAVKLRLIPKTMKGKEFLKRVFMGKLVPIPNELKEGMAEYTPLLRIQDYRSVDSYKVIFAVGQLS